MLVTAIRMTTILHLYAPPRVSCTSKASASKNLQDTLLECSIDSRKIPKGPEKAIQDSSPGEGRAGNRTESRRVV